MNNILENTLAKAKKKNTSRQLNIISQKIEKKPAFNSSLVKKIDPPKTPPPPYIPDSLEHLMRQQPKFPHKEINTFSPSPANNIKKEIILSKVPKNLRKIPAYMSYYRAIRERIRKIAYKYYKSDQKGEVFLTFTVSKEGQISSISLNPSASTKETHLINIALKSVKEAFPFKPFPKELKYNQLQFDISIYFKSR